MRIPGQAIRSRGTDREDRIGAGAWSRSPCRPVIDSELDTPVAASQRLNRPPDRAVAYRVARCAPCPVNCASDTRCRRSSSAPPHCSISPWRQSNAGSTPRPSATTSSPGGTPAVTRPSRLHGWARLAQATTRIALGTSVLTPTFRYHPAVVAQAMGTLGSMFPGRFWLGVGTGESMNEAPLGIEWPDTKERFARLKEAVTLIQTLMTNRSRHLRRHVLPDAQRHHLRPSRAADPHLHRGGGRISCAARRAGSPTG